MARGGESVAVVEDVGADLGRLVAAIGAQRFVLFLACPTIAFLGKETLIILGVGEAMGQPFDHLLEHVEVSGDGSIGQT